MDRILKSALITHQLKNNFIKKGFACYFPMQNLFTGIHYTRFPIFPEQNSSHNIHPVQVSLAQRSCIMRLSFLFPFFIRTVLSFYRSTKLHITSAGTAHILTIPCALPTTCQTPCIRHIFCQFFRCKLCKIPQKIFLQTAPVLFCQFTFSAIPF